MTGSPSPLRSRSNGPRGARSVSGCLTCRRRRVKCKMRNTPCDNCQHLNLACAPSFHHNFKNWTPITAQRPQIRVPKDVSDPELATNVNLEELESGMTETPLEATDTTREALPQDVLLWLSSGFNNDEFNLALPSPGQNFESRVPIEADYDLHSDYVDDWTLPPSSSPFQHEFNASHNVSRYHDKATCITTTTVRSQAPSNAASVAAPTSSGSRCGLDGLDSFLSSTFSCNSSSMLDIPPQIAQVYGNSHGGMPLLSQYENEMPKLLTAKASPWNPFNYMLNSTRDSPSSPLRHGILSWTCCYLSCRNQNHAYSGTAYYVFASNAIQNIVSELATCWSQEYSTMKSPKRSEMMYMLLSTAYFLSQCDIMLCDYQSLYDRLDSIKELLQQHWNKLKPSLSTLDRRLLTWLAYLDLRCSLFGNHKLRRTGNSKQYKDLISILIDLGALSSLRSVSGGQSYLSECYGDSYPETELQEDLAQEPCHMKCDDVLSIFSSLNSFESWNEEHPPQSGDSIIEELRNAKIQALRANLSRIRAECTILFPQQKVDNNGHVDRTSFHVLTVIALHLSATILLNRILKPEIRTDPESQEAAQEIIRIAYCLRKAKYLDTPRSLLWPLPLFIAGIETTDEIYQDWILSYLTELQHWGSYIEKSKELLQRICKRQQREKRRVGVSNAMKHFNIVVIV